MTHATFDQDAISAQLRTAGILNFALAKPCYRNDAFDILGRGAAPSPPPDKHFERRKPSSSPKHTAVAGSSHWSMACLPDADSQQHACDYDEEESVIANFLSGRQQASSNISAAQPSCPQPYRLLAEVDASSRLTGSRGRGELGSPGLFGNPLARTLGARRCRVQHAVSAAYRDTGVSLAIRHGASTSAALAAHVQWNRHPGVAPQDVVQLLSSSERDSTGPSHCRQQANSLRSQHTSSKAAHRLQHRAVTARSNCAQRSESYAGALRKRQALHAQAQQVPRPARQQQTGTVSSDTASDLSDPQLKYNSLLLKAFQQQPTGHCQSQRPETKWVSSSNNSTGQNFTVARTMLGVHADAVQTAQPQAATASASRPQRSLDCSGNVSWHQPATGKEITANGRATLFGALNAVTAANVQAAAALSAAARQAKAPSMVNQYVAVGTSKALSDDALIQMVTGWYRTADFGIGEQDLSAQHGTSNQKDKQQQQQLTQQQWHTAVVEHAVATEPSSSTTWSDGYPCSARCMCGVGYSWIDPHPGQQKQQAMFEQVPAASDKKVTACEQSRQEHKAGDKVVSITVLAGAEYLPLQELAEASSIIDELQHGLVDLRWTAEKLSQGDEVPVPLRQRYGSPVQTG